MKGRYCLISRPSKAGTSIGGSLLEWPLDPGVDSLGWPLALGRVDSLGRLLDAGGAGYAPRSLRLSLLYVVWDVPCTMLS